MNAMPRTLCLSFYKKQCRIFYIIKFRICHLADVPEGGIYSNISLKSETIVMYYEHPTLRDFVVCDIFTVFTSERQQFAMQQRRELVFVKNITFFVKNILPCNPLQWLHLQTDRRPCQKSLNIRKKRQTYINTFINHSPEGTVAKR